MRAFIEGLNLTGIHLFVQDWGGLIGLRVVAETPQRFASITAANTGLPAAPFPMSLIGKWTMRFQAWRKGESVATMADVDGFPAWMAHARYAREFNAGDVLQSATLSTLSADEVAAYQAPFPDEPYMAAPRTMPWLVPSELAQGRAAWKKLERLETPVLLLFSDSDPVTAGGEKVFLKHMKGTRGQPHAVIETAGHFLQEDKGGEIARRMIAWLGRL